ncbi:helix-turn-helix domain-containing protein [Ruegeria atlantica]|uniref:helix-turn-helix domain-containing protein n=1 Tax=Ruegeria atlantica TaxID=81569 RepID=UPI00071CBF8D
MACSDQTLRLIRLYLGRFSHTPNGVDLIQRKTFTNIQTVERAVRCASRTTCSSLKGVAEEIGMSPRSLQRLLMEQGTSFSQLLDSSRRQRAVQLLVREDLNLSEIARMLGYSDPSNFGRAVRKWTGQTPKQWRASLLRDRRQGIAHQMS